MTSTQTETPEVNEFHTTRSGRACVRLTTMSPRFDWEVLALDGHELLPCTRGFNGPTSERDARAYANQLWSTR